MNYTKALLSFLFLVAVMNVPAQNFYNLDFSRPCDTSKTTLCYWDLSWGSKTNIKQDVVDGNTCLLLHGNTKNDVAFTEQGSPFTPLKNVSILTVSALVKAENIEGKGAGLNLNLYNNEGQLLAFKDMGGFYSVDWITGTKAWREYSVSLVCPPGTAKIRIGAILFGKGNAWFKNYKVTLVPAGNWKPSKLAQQYITAFCDTIKKHSLVRDSFDIKKIKPVALNIAGNAKKYSDCYLAVNYILESLREYGDYHSFFMKANEVKNWEQNGSAVNVIEYPSYRVINDCGYIYVPPFHGGNKKTILAYADTLQSAIRQLETMGIKGWIVDLRRNTGGNMEPMIAGLGPLFSSEKLGSLVNVNNEASTWYYKNGKYFSDEYEGWNVSNPVTLKSNLPIAVLTSSQVGSSGEIVVISFIGNRNTRSFGQPTMGLTTGNGSFDLADNSRIFLASTIMADRNNRQYTGSIIPDVRIDNMIVDKVDMVLSAAIDWIKLQ